MSATVKTVRRDFLWRACKAGRLFLVEGYSFDDQHGATRTQPLDGCICNACGDVRLLDDVGGVLALCKCGGLYVMGMPVMPWVGPHDRRRGVAYLRPDEFQSSSGSAWKNPNGSFTLRVHSNSNYTFRLVKELT